jgi:tRNA (mo5U34)-methyltransferase
MQPANNMYLGGKPSERPWMRPSSKLQQRLARFFLPDCNRPPQPGTARDLPAAHRQFRPDLSAKEYRPVDFSHLRTAAPPEVAAAVAWVTENVGWFHSVDLKNGSMTPGHKAWQTRARMFNIAELARGKTVLDVGAMEGGDSFAAEEAGARVTAYDVDNYFEYDLGLNAAWEYVVEQYNQARAAGREREWIFLNSKRFGFELCRQVRQSSVTRISGSVYALDPLRHGCFDLVCCFGLLYHLRHPLLALDKIYAVTNELTLIQSQIFSGYAPEASTILFFNETWRGSYTNWFVPSPQALLDMVSSIGYRRIEVADVNQETMSLICYK